MKATTKGRPCFNDTEEDVVERMRTQNCTIVKARVIRKLSVLEGLINPVTGWILFTFIFHFQKMLLKRKSNEERF